MTTWIVGIDAENPEHWDMAIKYGFWDMTRPIHFERGDTLHFWQAGASLLGTVRVTRSTYPRTPGTPMPWNLSDAKREKYGHRVDFETVAETAESQPSWSELTRHTGVRGATNFGPRRVPKDGEAWLLDQIGGSDSPVTAAESLALSWARAADGEDETDLEEDMRTWVEATIVLREGQRRFREAVLGAYGGVCCISGSSLVPVLDAAHIAPHKGRHTDRVDNALCLRTDLHKLFDRHLLTVLADGTVRLAPTVMDEEYRRWDRSALRLPAQTADRPRVELLQRHNELCTWLP